MTPYEAQLRERLAGDPSFEGWLLTAPDGRLMEVRGGALVEVGVRPPQPGLWTFEPKGWGGGSPEPSR